MKLTREGLKDREKWIAAGYSLPEFDREKVMENTKKAPEWIHFGVGNIFRAYQCNLAQKLLDCGKSDKGITAVEGYDYEIIEKLNRPYDDYSILVTLKSDGTVEKKVVGSIMESLTLDSENESEFSRLKEIFASESLKMASFTITEKGYSLTDGKGRMLDAVAADLENGPSKPVSYIGKVSSLLYTRYKSSATPIAMVSMDNCSHNGDKLSAAVKAFAEGWCERGLADKGFADYVSNPSKVSFPWTMIDKITPRPDPSVYEILCADGVSGLEQTVTSKNTYIAPFVNAEECEYLVIEDSFPNGRPPLDAAGVIFTDRETVDKVEKMKVCTCLNPLHTTLAVFGCLLGYKLISEEMKNKALLKLVEGIGFNEGLPVVVDPGIISPEKFIKEVLYVRIPNPFMPDTPQRIATDTSQKLAVRFGETTKAYIESDSLKVSSLKLIPLVFAGWIRYLMGIDDKGVPFELSPDPLLPGVAEYVRDIKLGDRVDSSKFEALYKNKKIFGVDLFEAGLAEKVTEYFNELIAGPGAVLNTIQKYTL
ncbi:MAG: mannitol dehydrogenase family protein [Clostridia bacterium]|nr:mannitol dehydrogenase family protein [Clostridia bacterium]